MPIDQFISNQQAFYRKKEKAGQGTAQAVSEAANRALGHREELEMLAQAQGLFLIPEYEFEHAIYPIPPETMSPESNQQGDLAV